MRFSKTYIKLFDLIWSKPTSEWFFRTHCNRSLKQYFETEFRIHGLLARDVSKMAASEKEEKDQDTHFGVHLLFGSFPKIIISSQKSCWACKNKFRTCFFKDSSAYFYQRFAFLFLWCEAICMKALFLHSTSSHLVCDSPDIFNQRQCHKQRSHFKWLISSKGEETS